MRFLLTLFLLLASFGLLAQSSPDLKISVGDKLSVTVVGYKDFTGIFEVASDGTISGPGIGILKVAGKTIAEANRMVTGKFQEILQDPQVFVGMETERIKIVYVVGLPPESASSSAGTQKTASLNLPAGQVPLTAATTVRSLLAGATLGDRPDRLEAVVVRNGETFRKIDLYQLLHDDAKQFDGPLQANDILVVRPKSTVKAWFVGGFKQPGDHLVPEGITIDQAIGYVGGYDPQFINDGNGNTGNGDASNAFLGRIRIQLRRGDTTQILAARAGSPDLNQKIEAGDTLTLVLPKSVNVTVAGFVQRAGEVVVDSGAGAYAAIAKAGGVLSSGSVQAVTLFRGTEMYRLNVDPGSAKPSIQTMELQPGDIVYVGDNRRFVQVLGSVWRPGSVFLTEDKRVFHASDALAGAGGINPTGSLLRAVLLHPDGTGKYQRTQFNLDKFLKDGDVTQNPEVVPGDVLFFDTPKGITGPGLLQLATTIAVLNSYGVKL